MLWTVLSWTKLKIELDWDAPGSFSSTWCLQVLCFPEAAAASQGEPGSTQGLEVSSGSSLNKRRPQVPPRDSSSPGSAFVRGFLLLTSNRVFTYLLCLLCCVYRGAGLLRSGVLNLPLPSIPLRWLENSISFTMEGPLLFLWVTQDLGGGTSVGSSVHCDCACSPHCLCPWRCASLLVLGPWGRRGEVRWGEEWGLLPRLGCVQPPYLHQEAISLRPCLPEVPWAEISALQGSLPSFLCTVPSRCSGFWRRARLSQLANVANVSRGKRGRVWLPAWCRDTWGREQTWSCPASVLAPRVLITGRPWLFGRVLGRKGTIRDINIKLSFLGWRLVLWYTCVCW